MRKQSIKVEKYKQQIWQAAISAFVLLNLIIPKATYAFWLLDIASAQETSLKAYSINSTYNSQNIPLLTPAHNTFAYSTATGGADINILDSSTIIAPNIPYDNGSSPHIPETQIKNGGQIKIYVVQKGDTLSEIAEKFNVSVNTIRWANDLGRKGLIKIGQELIILPIDGVKYKVKNGGTLRDIIKKIGGNLDEAVVFNDLDPDTYLEKGTEVLIPEAELQEPKVKAQHIAKSVRTYSNLPPVYKGYFMRPVRGGIKTQGIHGKNAVDIASTYGAAIYAAANGKVIISKGLGWHGGYGSYIVINHPNGTQTLYAHLSKNYVSKDQYVKQGQIIGAMGSSGKSTGTHLHFEIHGARNPF